MGHYIKTAVAVIVLASGGCAALRTYEPKSIEVKNVISAQATLDVVREDFVFTEGPLPTDEGGLLFTDLRASKIYRLSPSGNITVLREQTNETNGLAYTPRGELVAAETGGKRLTISGADARVRELTNGDGEKPLAAVNDLIVDAK